MPIVSAGVTCPSMWTSRQELELLFGATPISQWADVENTNNPQYIQAKIDWAVRVATSDAKSRLNGSIADGITNPGDMLRAMTTALAAVWLYTARGVKDTSSDEGRFRLSWARKKADDWFNDVVAGKIELLEATPPTQYPVVIAPLSPYLSPFGPRLTPEQQLAQNQQHELQGVQNSASSAYNLWWNGFQSDAPVGETGVLP